MRKELEERVGFILAWGALAVTILVSDRVNSDPVNVSKMLLLSVIGFTLLPVIFNQKSELFRNSRSLTIATIGFTAVAVLSIFTSANPVERGLFGAFGRNTGLISYVSLLIIFLTATLVSQDRSFHKVMTAFALSGFVNILLSLSSAAGYEIFKWENPYNAVLGTFGNPNFVSAFMGLMITYFAVQLLDQSVTFRWRLTYLGLLPLAALTLYFSKSLQGVLVASLGSALAIYFYIRSKPGLTKIKYLYAAALALAGFLGLSGILNKGPLSSILFGPTVKFRGEYWSAGVNMGLDHPFTGVGLDSYGLYYRTYRQLSATISPGMDVGTDSAHNVYIDIFSGIGFPGLTFYLIMNLIVLIAAMRHLKRFRSFDGRFLAIFLCWVGYQLQSIASINQLGLAVWGWLFGGLIIAYTRTHKNEVGVQKINVSKVEKTTKSGKDRAPQLLDASSTLKMISGGVVGLLIALPPFIADAKMRDFFSKKTGSAENVFALGTSWPADNVRLNKIIVALANGNDIEKARELAVYTSLKFPNDYGAWWALDQLTRDGMSEKDSIRMKLHEIDPHNPNYFKE